MLSVFLVCYDIRDPKRLRRVFKTMRGFGDHLQLSVFRCELSDATKVRMLMALQPVLKNDEDQVLVFRLGPLDGTYTVQVDCLGVPYVPGEHEAVVV
jgi:CRISPR-associated protein Cas2